MRQIKGASSTQDGDTKARNDEFMNILFDKRNNSTKRAEQKDYSAGKDLVAQQKLYQEKLVHEEQTKLE